MVERRLTTDTRAKTHVVEISLQPNDLPLKICFPNVPTLKALRRLDRVRHQPLLVMACERIKRRFPNAKGRFLQESLGVISCHQIRTASRLRTAARHQE